MAKFAVVLLAVVCSLSYQSLAAPSNVIEPSLRHVLQTGQKANVFISLKVGTASVLSRMNSMRFSDRTARLNTVASSLKNHAAESQQNILSVLEKSGVKYQSFWISNQVFIREASLEIVEKIAALTEVSSIEEEILIPVAKPEVTAVFEARRVLPRENQWGVLKIEADRVWRMPGGTNGTGVVLANVDTGVRGTHQDLRNNFFGAYGWFDPSNRTPEPNDQNGHGTHTMGTIAGHNGIGVAPGATWQACKGCATSSCAQSDLTACGEFFACPTDTNGQNPDCSKAPHVVSNSWGGGAGGNFYDAVVAGWRAAGVIPFFSAGNNGPSCSSLGYPGEHADVIGVGSTVIDDTLSSFSSVGPKSDGLIQPDIAAPGSNVYSAYYTSDTAYSTLSGTSMACPHAAAAGGLILAVNPHFKYDDIKAALANGADTDVVKTGRNCGSISENFFPNNAFGHGRINAYKSIMGRKN